MLKRFFRPIALMLAALLVAAVCFTVIIYKRTNNEGKSNVGDNALNASLKNKTEKPFCVLIIGKDKVSALADVIMLAAFDKTEKSVCIVQIPRDTYAEYGNSSYFKINGALRALGEEGMCSFFEDTMGIAIDGYISLDLEGFRAVVDTIGGVEMNIDRALKYSDPEQDLYIDLPSGKQTLNGKQAEMLVRYRSGYIRGDLDRLDIQKKFLAAFFLQLKEKINPFSIYGIASSVLPYLKTNISASELISLGLSVMTVKTDSVRLATLPGEDAVSRISGGSFYVVSKKSAQELLELYFGAESESFDTDGLFLHPRLDSFKEIYEKRVENDTFSIDHLK